ncbi:phospholipase A2-like [Aphidius gifuensis]|uniref:phospholipase A2-like n=1 Tax=Aphidius gifuensis TaxID=684658 RepID=UPI001CDC3BC3|nr:phospholipase A2-like [Aphidius gifuensis]
MSIIYLFFLLSIFWIYNINSLSVVIDYDSNEDENIFGEFKNRQQDRMIFPGTKWCGRGNISEGYDDLGYYEEVDKCCRSHDYCPDVIEGYESKHNLTNLKSYARLHCSCDEEFYDCLHDLDHMIGNQIGRMYFTLLHTQCFREDYPIVSCKHYSTFPKRCLEYELDESQEQIYQWFDVPCY